MGLSLLNELNKTKDKFFYETLSKMTDDKQKKGLYLIYRVCNAVFTWGTIIIVSAVTILTGTNVAAVFG